MKATIARAIAILFLVIPGLAATYGFILIKNAIFAQFEPSIGHVLWGKLILGLLLFVSGVAFIGGWIFFRDRKRNYLQPRFAKKRD